MSGKPLDASWKGWLAENIERNCDPEELVRILLAQQFSLESIRESMGERFPGGAAIVTASAKRLDDGWKTWLKENLERQCDASELVGILRKHQFSLDSIREAMGERFPAAAIGTDHAALAQAPFSRGAAAPRLQKVATDRLQLCTLDGFMSGAECDALARLIARHLRPSTVTLGGTDRDFRTSSTCDLGLLQDPAVAALDERIARTLGIRSEYSEPIQAQRYEVGQQFKPHTDYFEPGTDEYAEHAASRGNRTWTFMVYLNDDLGGGGTRFVAIDRTFFPRQGQALLWNNLYPDGRPNYDTLHSGLPVERGRKIIITKWFREKGSGPMFWSDAGSAA